MKKKFITQAFGELNNNFQDEFNKIYHDGQRMSDYFSYKTEFKKKKGFEAYSFGHLGQTHKHTHTHTERYIYMRA